MKAIEQVLRTLARKHRGTPYWVLEKDYALGYLLAGTTQIPTLSESLILKGGTALRKFYFADCCFSAELDFSTTGADDQGDRAAGPGRAFEEERTV
jgi:uncharacterized protein